MVCVQLSFTSSEPLWPGAASLLTERSFEDDSVKVRTARRLACLWSRGEGEPQAHAQSGPMTPPGRGLQKPPPSLA